MEWPIHSESQIDKREVPITASNGVVLKKLYSTCLLKEYFEAGTADMY